MVSTIPQWAREQIQELTEDQWSAAMAEARQQGISLKEAVCRMGLMTESNLLQALGRILGCEYVDLADGTVDPQASALVSAQIASHYQVVPIELHDDIILLATDDPFQENLEHELSTLLNKPVRLCLAAKPTIARASRKSYGIGAETVEQLVSSNELLTSPAEEDVSLGDENAARQASVIKLVNQILTDAISQRATDIHFEPFEEELRIRYRIDGELYEAGAPAAVRHFRHTIISRIKIISNLDIAERRIPQDGRAQITLNQAPYDLRISILPTPYGEAANVRILPRAQLATELSDLGIEGKDLHRFQELLKKPHGIILVTGPTGSGKTTTLYTCLGLLNRPNVKILTIEDPIEYHLHGITQMQVLPEIDFTFSRALKSMLRHDPDIMLIGEIRDLETAAITVRTALTGHLVFSTLHTNDAPGAIARLLDMIIEPFLIASSVEAILAQRLVRTVCPLCRQWIKPPSGLLPLLKDVIPSLPEKIASPKGCRECRFTGYRGRTAITELLVIDDEIREMVQRQAHTAEIAAAAHQKDMLSLAKSALHKVAAGITTYNEALRVAPLTNSPDIDSPGD